MNVNPYVFFDGNCRAAFDFYSEVLGVKPAMMMTLGESPVADQMPGLSKDAILHANIDLGSTQLMGGDTPIGRYAKPQGISLALSFSTVEEAERVYNELSAGGQVYMPFGKTFWATGFGMISDKFGIDWMITTEDTVS